MAKEDLDNQLEGVEPLINPPSAAYPCLTMRLKQKEWGLRIAPQAPWETKVDARGKINWD